MNIYNSLTRRIEEIEPISKGKIGLYTCGPTVYDTATVGNFRTYILSDLMVRSLRNFGYDVTYAMNVTDVGHLTGDNEGDADTGEDRMEKGAKREGESAWDIAAKYTAEFQEHMKKLNMIPPNYLLKATEHVQEQIDLVKRLEDAGFTYATTDGVYFNTKAYEKMGFKYGELSTLDEVREGARVQPNPEKRDKRDFALWKFSPKGERRQMEWDSPWGVGFPGWHIECSAMSMKCLGDQFDIHVGGEDLRSTHHPNEIAQSQGATGKLPFVKYWMHGAFLLVDGGRMGKSLGNAYTLNDIEQKGFDPLALRYFYMTGHYRKQLNFTWESLSAAQTALDRLRVMYLNMKNEKERNTLSEEKLKKVDGFREEFDQALGSDLDMPRALAVVWDSVKSNIPSYDKVDLLRYFDRVLGFNFEEFEPKISEVKPEVKDLLKKRDRLREERKYEEADRVRENIEKMGYKVKDTPEGSRVV